LKDQEDMDFLTRYEFDRKDIKIKPEEAAEILYRDAGEKDRIEFASGEMFVRRYNRLYETYLHILEPAGFTRPLNVADFLEIFAETLPDSSPIFQAVKFWKKGAIFIVTIGPDLENSIKSLIERGELTDALFLDAMGSALVEKVAEMVERKWAKSLLKREHIPDGVIAVRYSPGYCQWDVKAQETLFGYMGDDGIPVSLTPGGMMHPRKSISGVVVLEETDPSSSLVAACRECKKMCRYMRKWKQR